MLVRKVNTELKNYWVEITKYVIIKFSRLHLYLRTVFSTKRNFVIDKSGFKIKRCGRLILRFKM